MPYDRLVELALYDSEYGFYLSGGRAGRRGDFLTSPEVGPLFGHVVSRALDDEWDRLGQPDDFTIVEFGAGPGTLARTVFAAEPRCLRAARYIAIERSARQREEHPDGVVSIETLTEELIGSGLTGVVLANELLDNLAFTPVKWENDKPQFVMVELNADGQLVAVARPDNNRSSSGLIPNRSRVDQSEAANWLSWALRDVLTAGRLIVFDYGRQKTAEVEVRTFSEHGPAGDPLVGLGTKDITVDVDLEVLQRRVRTADAMTSQEAWLTERGINELVDEGRAIWQQLAGSGGLDALKALSRVREAEALCDPKGLGGFSVVEWQVS